MIPFPNKKYQIIYADPPWKEVGGGQIKRGADAHYQLMSTKDIMALPVRSIVDTNAHLYLWVTNNFLIDGLRVMESWGFEYKTIITWFKDRFGLGQYFRGITEQCLFGVRGFLPYKIENDKRCQGITGFFEKRKEHSRKPESMKDMIELVSCREGTNQIELFARPNREQGKRNQMEMFRNGKGFVDDSPISKTEPEGDIEYASSPDNGSANENLPHLGKHSPVHYIWDTWGNEI
jgi:N6-adenosine-specific RNA methylase IME4